MFIVHAFMDLLVVLFLVGLAGSAIVVTMAFVEDFGVLFGKDDEPDGLTPIASVSPAETAHAVPRH